MSRVEEIRSNAKGSTFPEISRARFRSMDVAIPEDNALIEFNNVVEPLMQQVRILAKQNAFLATARDMLLPRLMKGELV
jgi:type I restriction enzyme S subunit